MEITPENRSVADAPQILRQQIVKTDKSNQAGDAPVKTTASETPPTALPVQASHDLGQMIQVLIQAGLKADSSNIKMLEAMLLAGFKADDYNISKMNRAFNVSGQSIEKALFFMHSEMNITSANAAALNRYAESGVKILDQIQSIFAEIEALPEGELKSRLLEIFNVPPEAPDSGASLACEKNEVMDITQTGQNQEPLNALKPSDSHQETNPPTKLDSATPVLSPAGPSAANQNVDKSEPAKTMLNKIAADLNKPVSEISRQEISEFIANLSDNETDKGFLLNELVKKAGFVPENAHNIDPASAKTEVDQLFRLINTILTSENNKTEQLFKNVIKKISLDIERDGKDDIDKVLNILKKKLDQADEIIKTPDLKERVPGSVIRTFKDASDNISFMNGIKNSVYVQIPVMINNKATNAELFVFPNKKKGGSQAGQSALISLDLVSLGHFEAYIHKNGRQINCQFRVLDETAENTVKAELSRLDTLLRDKNLTLTGVSYRKVTEPFTVISKEPDTENASAPEIFFDLKI